LSTKIPKGSPWPLPLDMSRKHCRRRARCPFC
jgi:hypothetical protein